jgi:hypothetical protein
MKNDNMFFWVAQSVATYYANFSKGAGFPDMSASVAMSAGNEYLASVPEPATVLLLGLGGVLLRIKNRYPRLYRRGTLKFRLRLSSN